MKRFPVLMMVVLALVTMAVGCTATGKAGSSDLGLGQWLSGLNAPFAMGGKEGLQQWGIWAGDQAKLFATADMEQLEKQFKELGQGASYSWPGLAGADLYLYRWSGQDAEAEGERTIIVKTVPRDGKSPALWRPYRATVNGLGQVRAKLLTVEELQVVLYADATYDAAVAAPVREAKARAEAEEQERLAAEEAARKAAEDAAKKAAATKKTKPKKPVAKAATAHAPTPVKVEPAPAPAPAAEKKPTGLFD